MDPFNWIAYQELCEISRDGVNTNPDVFFGASNYPSEKQSESSSEPSRTASRVDQKLGFGSYILI